MTGNCATRPKSIHVEVAYAPFFAHSYADHLAPRVADSCARNQRPIDGEHGREAADRPLEGPHAVEEWVCMERETAREQRAHRNPMTAGDTPEFEIFRDPISRVAPAAL